jgi:hypothetical protein
MLALSLEGFRPRPVLAPRSPLGCHPERSEGSAFLSCFSPSLRHHHSLPLPLTSVNSVPSVLKSPHHPATHRPHHRLLSTTHHSLPTISLRIRTYEKRARNPFGIRTSKTQDLKSFRIRTYEKTPGGSHLSSQKPPLPAKSLSLPRYFVTSLLHLSLHGTNAPLARLHRCRGEIHA